MGRCGHDEFVDAPLSHQLASAFVGHSGKEVGLSFLIRRRFGGLLGTKREVPHRKPLNLHEWPPEFVAVEHPFGQQMSVDIDQHGIPILFLFEGPLRDFSVLFTPALEHAHQRNIDIYSIYVYKNRYQRQNIRTVTRTSPA